MAEMLYTPELLRLAADLPHAGRLAAADASVERRSATCGSRVRIDVALGPDDRIAALGVDVNACALGQASAALFAARAIGRNAAELAAARDAVAAWLRGEAGEPDWPRLALLAPALPHSGRHPAIRLAFEAAAEAAALATQRRSAAA